MLPREGTETDITYFLIRYIYRLITHVTSRGDGNVIIGLFLLLKNRLITHVTSRGDFLGEIHKTT